MPEDTISGWYQRDVSYVTGGRKGYENIVGKGRDDKETEKEHFKERTTHAGRRDIAYDLIRKEDVR